MMGSHFPSHSTPGQKPTVGMGCGHPGRGARLSSGVGEGVKVRGPGEREEGLGTYRLVATVRGPGLSRGLGWRPGDGPCLPSTLTTLTLDPNHR